MNKFNFIPRSDRWINGHYIDGIYHIDLDSGYGSPEALPEIMEKIITTPISGEIQIHQHTPGGEVRSLIALRTALSATQASVKLFLGGMNASCGGMLLDSATPGEIYVAEESIIMFHHMTIGGSHNVHVGKVLMENSESIGNIMFDSLLEKGILTKEERMILEETTNDVIITGRQLIERGVAHLIGA